MAPALFANVFARPVFARPAACNRSLPLAFRSVVAPTPSRLIARAEADNAETAVHGEWPVNWSLASYDDVGEFFQNQLFKESAAPGNVLADVMSTQLTTTTPETKVEDVKGLFEQVTGIPVVKSSSDRTLVGVLSRKDLSKPGSHVKDIMSTPPIASKPDNKVAEAACLMLKHKVHRIPIVDKDAKLVGIVTRTDIFTALAMATGTPEL